jgi:hypothetical protein
VNKTLTLASTPRVPPSFPGRSLLLAGLLLLPQAAGAQTVLGRVLDAVTKDGIGDAEIVLRTTGGELVGRTLSESSGRFIIHLDEAGLFILSLSRLGYATEDSASVHVGDGGTRYLEIELQPEALGLPGITVRGDPQVPHLERSGFYHRRDRGQGRFLGPDEINARMVTQASEFLRRVPFIRLQYRGTSKEPVIGRGIVSLRHGSGACYPDVVVDGVKVREGGPGFSIRFDDLLAPHEVEAMEVYAGGSTVPRQWLSDSGCGLVVVWTKR